jgi:exosortase
MREPWGPGTAARAALGGLLALSIAGLYADTVTGLVVQWVASPDASYGVVLASVALAIAWRRRDPFVLAIDRHAAAAPGATVLLVGLFVYLTGQLGADVFLTRVSLVLVLTGTVWFLFGSRSVRTIAAPLVFLLAAMPLPELIVNSITLPLQFTASRIAEMTLTTFGVPVFRDGNVLELPSTALEVAEACSGLRSIVSLAAISGLLAWTDPSWPRRIAVIVSSLPVAIVMNGLRIAATGLACETWGPAAASGSWHTFTGWITFLVSVFVLVRLQRVIARTEAIVPAWKPGVAGA